MGCKTSVQIFKSTSSPAQNPYVFASVAGIRTVPCPSLPDLICPFCGSTDTAMMMGKISFSATISGDDLFGAGLEALVGVLCERSHFFLLREKDVLVAKVEA